MLENNFHKMKGTFDPRTGDIQMELTNDISGTLSRWVCRTQEGFIRQGLQKFGWIPPEDAKELTEALRVAQAHIYVGADKDGRNIERIDKLHKNIDRLLTEYEEGKRK